MSELKSYEVATVDRGYHVYVAVWEATVGQVALPVSVAVVENNDTPVNNDAPYSMKIFAIKTFANYSFFLRKYLRNNTGILYT